VTGRATQLVGALDHIAAPVRFAAAQIAALLPALGLAGVLWASRPRASAAPSTDISDADRLYLAFVALGPFVFAEILSIVTGLGLRPMWGGPLWCFIGLFLVMMIRPSQLRVRLRRFAVAWVIVSMLPLVAYAGIHGIGPMVKENEKRSSFPGDALADTVTARWRDATGRPLRFVVGDMWLAGNVAFYSPDRPAVFQDADAAANPWVDAVALAIDGAVLVWDADAKGDQIPVELQRQFPAAVKQQSLVLAKLCPRTRKPVRIGWALAAPARLSPAR
jgi:hypothetical protein